MPIEITAFNAEMSALIDDVQQSLVQIAGPHGSLGAGIVWQNDGLIVTNAHVVSGEDVHVILPEGTAYPARLIAADAALDIAVLSISATDLSTIAIGDSRGLRAGQWVIAVGHPYGVLGSATAGSVIATGEELPGLGGNHEWIALNLRLRPGHSGSPLVDVQGRLVGLNTLITGPEVGFAIPAHVITRFLALHVPAAGIAAV